MIVQTIIFSKDRALQLQAALQSFFIQCTDAHETTIRVLYKASDSRHERQYCLLQSRFPAIQFVAETHFQSQLLRLVADSPWILFLVDDVIFHKSFSLAECIAALEGQPGSLGLSLLLGRNTVYCFTQNAPQALPDFQSVENSRLLRFLWPDAELDFGYPLEVSGSIYSTRHILPLLYNISFDNPNKLESELSLRTAQVKDLPWRLVFPDSVGFCIPLNRVQQVFANRISTNSVDAETLADYFDQGQTIDLDVYNSITPNAAHIEAPIRLSPKTSLNLVWSPPRMSAVIPVYNGAAFLPEAVASLIDQQYEHLEILIVDDGSQDDSALVALQLSAKYPQFEIRLIRKENGGLADARNAGIRAATGEWILPLDCDDRLAPNFLARAIEVIRKFPDINIVFANMQEFGASNKTWIPPDYSMEAILLYNTFPYASLYRKQLWKWSSGYDPSLPWGAEDWNFWISCSTFGLKPYRIADLLFQYRVHPQGSMYTRMMAHWNEVQACVRTLHPTLYPIITLLKDHQTISCMHPATLNQIENIIAKHPQLPMPYFWRGLTYEKAGNIPEALADYTRSAALAPYAQWQSHFRSYLLNKTLGRTAAAQRAALNARNRRPDLAYVFCNDPCFGLKYDSPRIMPGSPSAVQKNPT